MKSRELTHETLKECRQKLLIMKQDILNRVRASAQNFSQSRSIASTSGDEADQTVAQLEEHEFLISQERMRHHLREIELALARLQDGTFGICEETEEQIEAERLLAVPWTRLSIEGAEIREALSRKFAR
ncbi:MAG: TraR/DksA family transcriptional regulator [Bdellovibrionaceae bacterium]|nr:TraR/DksA family transcriptional regulator [Pseudobdellovibrionaceae bacterium]MBX3033621.1 TraR/DksA family transcriptional regulator [Pseudobdellovibrionaceae bacterium]